MPSPKTTWNIGLRANQGVSSGIEDVVNLESWSTDALGGFTRYGLSERENASMDIDLGYEHKYGERHVLAVLCPLVSKDQHLARLPVARPAQAPCSTRATSPTPTSTMEEIGTPPSKWTTRNPWTTTAN